MAGEQALHIDNELIMPGQDPAVSQGWFRLLIRCGRSTLDRVQDQAPCIPQLVGKIAVSLHPLQAQVEILAGRGSGQQRKAQRIGAECVHHFKRVDHIAKRLAHLAAVLIAHQAVEIDFRKRHLARQGQAGDNHPGHPEEQDVVPGLHH